MTRIHCCGKCLALLFICCGLTSAAGASESAGCDSLQLLGHEIACGTSSKFPFIPDGSFEAAIDTCPTGALFNLAWHDSD